MSYITLTDLRGLSDIAASDVQGVAALLLAARGPVSAGLVTGAVAAWTAAALKASTLVGSAGMPQQAPLQAALTAFVGAAQGFAANSSLAASDLQGNQDALEGLINTALSLAGSASVPDAGITPTQIGIGVGVAAVVLGLIWYYS